MKAFINTNPYYGSSGPFFSKDKESFVNECSFLVLWAKEKGIPISILKEDFLIGLQQVVLVFARLKSGFGIALHLKQNFGSQYVFIPKIAGHEHFYMEREQLDKDRFEIEKALFSHNKENCAYELIGIEDFTEFFN